MNTIIVDDDPTNRERVRRWLASAGHECRLFETADDAAAGLSDPACAVDLVVTDVQMPGELDGVDLASLLKVTRPGLPVVVMSAGRDELDRALARGLAVPTLKKPFRQDELLDAVATALSRPERTGSRTISGPRLASGSVLADPGRVLSAMMREARSTGHPHVGTEHIALAALEGPGGFHELATSSGLDPKALRPSLVACCVEPASRREPGLTSRAAGILAVAAQLAVLDGASEVRSRDLVAALITVSNATAWAGLASAGLDRSLVIEALLVASQSVAASRQRLS